MGKTLQWWIVVGCIWHMSAVHGAESEIETGRYLAVAGNCYGCHTRPGAPAYAGGVAFKTPFGVIYSSNITPDEKTGIGRWTDADLIRAMHEGVAADGTHLYPVFPYPSYTRVLEKEIKAIYAYLRTVPAVSNVPPENQLGFPYNQRWLLPIWNALYLDQGRYESNPSLSAEANRGAYLLHGLGHCGACHTPRNFLGGPQQERALSGATYLDEVAAGKTRPWYAINLTSGPGGLKDWSAQDIATYLKRGYNRNAASFGPMNEVIEHSTRHLSDADLQAIGAYLKTLAPLGETVEHALSDEVRRDGQILYDSYCGTCHLPTGLGSEDTGPPLVGSPVTLGAAPASLINSILYGAQAAQGLAIPQNWREMKAFGDELDDEQVAILATFIRNSWGNRAGPVTAEQVKAQR